MTKKTPKAEATSLKRRSTTHSDLAKKYGTKRVAHVRDMIKAETRNNRLSPAEWEVVGRISRVLKKTGDKISLSKVDDVRKRTLQKGVEPEFKKYIKK